MWINKGNKINRPRELGKADISISPLFQLRAN